MCFFFLCFKFLGFAETSHRNGSVVKCCISTTSTMFLLCVFQLFLLFFHLMSECPTSIVYIQPKCPPMRGHTVYAQIYEQRFVNTFMNYPRSPTRTKNFLPTGYPSSSSSTNSAQSVLYPAAINHISLCGPLITYQMEPVSMMKARLCTLCFGVSPNM